MTPDCRLGPSCPYCQPEAYADSTDPSVRAVARIKQRDAVGMASYGVPLRAGNPRENLVDLADELADALKYTETEIIERRELNAALLAWAAAVRRACGPLSERDRRLIIIIDRLHIAEQVAAEMRE